MKILGFNAVHGPNVYHSKPVILMRVDLGKWHDTSSLEIPAFNERLMALLPGLAKHRCSPGIEGGFYTRLKSGTYLAHIIEHVALELSALADIEVTFGKARNAGAPGIYVIVTRFENEAGMQICLEEAFHLVSHLIGEEPHFDLNAAIRDIKKISLLHQLGPTTQSLIDLAQKRDIPIRRVTEDSFFQLGYGRNRRLIQASLTDSTNVIATDLVQDKDLTKKVLNSNFISTPQGCVVYSLESLEDCLKEITPPIAIKPVDGHHGEGVSLHLTDIEEIKQAFHIAKAKSKAVIVEEMCLGSDYRVLIVNKKFCAAAERRPPFVVGDGQASVQQLIDILNQDPRRGDGHYNVLTKVYVDPILLKILERQSMTPDSVPAKDQVIYLRDNGNISTGATSIDVTDKVHPEIKQICERIARIVNLDICGIDIIHQDISLPISDSFKVIEVNAAPGIRMHIDPTVGTPQPVAEAIMDMLYPPGSTSRIPIISVTGTNGKTTVVRLINKILSTGGTKIGMTTTSGIWINNNPIAKGDLTGRKSAQTVLADPLVETAVLEVARGGILRDGLGYDWSDVGVITNIRHDHLGQDGINDLEDLIWIKSLIAERVKEDGWVILNADDPAALSLKKNPRVTKIPKNYFLYSTNFLNPELTAHLADGGQACWSGDGWIYFQRGRFTYRLMPIIDVPLTLNGTVSFQISNCLAAVAAALCMNVEVNQIKEALKEFDPISDNVGRLSTYKIRSNYVVLDYGHNPDAMSALGEFAKTLKGYSKTIVLGLPGDRAAELIEQSAKNIAENFDQVIIRDDVDLRGRMPGEVPKIVENYLKKNFPHVVCTTILNEKEAIDHVLNQERDNSLVVMIYEDLDNTMKYLRQYDPTPINGVPEAGPIEAKNSRSANNKTYPNTLSK